MPSPAYPQNFFRYFLLAILAVCLGGATLVAGLGAGRAAVAHFLRDTAPRAFAEHQGNPHFGPPPARFPITYREADFTHAIEAVRDAVVSINVEVAVGGGTRNQTRISGSGSGFIFYKDENFAYIATNNHVIENATYIYISLDDETRLPTRAIGANPAHDLAVLSVSLEYLVESGKPFSIAALGCSDSLRMGDCVVAIGNALGEGQRTTQGIVSALDLTITVPNPTTGENLSLFVFQTDAAVNRGNSGGPLINERGEVVGIITAKFMGAGVEGMGYVLPIGNIRAMLEDIREVGSVIIPFMGIRHDHISEELRELFNLPAIGQWITRVAPNTPADTAGLRRGDLIIRFGEVDITSFEVFRQALIASAVGETVTLGIIRNNEFMEIEITLGAPR
ncbi:MAG: trypsin-like peptidase domain-containing protein [Defluviitaleaceae bacterium]|nr:trypsin-like peptidase domain-containing protein [Defluviitaleaceae bacterium]MCL2240596.1 trypsin-like peptidase domain-containing protein [Defluviitaleaceae bacterium]